MEFEFSDEFKDNLKSLPKRIRKKAYKQLSFLQTNFWHPSLHTEKIEGMTFQGRDVRKAHQRPKRAYGLGN